VVEEVQQLGLCRGQELADLVEEDRAARGRGEQSPPILVRAGVSALHRSEELPFEERVGNRRAIHRDEGAVRAPSGLVDRPRHHVLADPGLAHDEDRRVAGAALDDPPAHVTGGGRGADEGPRGDLAREA
jgi:hypothetical protein